KVISFNELQDENAILKRDLKNLDMNVRKLRLDHQQLNQTQISIDERATELGSRYLKESVRWIGSSLNQSNYSLCKRRLMHVMERCRAIGFSVSNSDESELLANLKSEFEL